MNHSNLNTLDLRSIFSFKALLLKGIGVCCTVIAIKGFMIPNLFLDGGLLGISILLHEFYHIEVWIPLLLLNLPFVYFGYGGSFPCSDL